VARSPFAHVHISDLEAVPVTDTLVWRPVRRTLGIQAFGVNAYTAANAGDELIEDHDEGGHAAGRHEELYVVLSGRAAFTVGDEEIDAPAGTLVFIGDPSVRRGARAAEPGSTVLAIGGKAGEPYEVSAWEHFFAAIPHARAGDWELAAETVAAGLPRYADNPALLYNLGCYEARAGRREDAVEHVRRALELDPKLRAVAVEDEDLDSVRADLGLAAA
jgi:mannose-6-phosphate isomerase-like protein (cupin superfamily)